MDGVFLLFHALALVQAGGSPSTLQVHAPAPVAGSYAHTVAPFAPGGFNVTGLLAIASSCPCKWLLPSWEDEQRQQSLVPPGGMPTNALSAPVVLLLPKSACSVSCSARAAACGATKRNFSAVLISQDNFDLDIAAISGDDQLDFDSHAEKLAAERAEYSVLTNATCSDGFSPSAFILANLSQMLFTAIATPPTVNATGAIFAANELTLAVWEEVNLTFARSSNEEEVDCTRFVLVPFVYLLLVPIWWFLTVLWAWNTYRKNAASARDLHRLLCWVPIMQFMHGVLSLFYYFSCPWNTTISLVYATFWAVVTILKEPVMLLCLLLVSKGWCITRHTLQRNEVCVAGAILALLYASVSVQLSLQSPLAVIPMVIMYLAMLADISFAIVANLRILKAQLIALRSLGVDPITTPAYTKYMMFWKLAGFTAVYTMSELAIHWGFTGRYDDYYWLFILLHQLMELTIAIGIGYTFRAQPFNILFHQVQQVAQEIADQLLPTITTVEIKPGILSGGNNLIAWRESLDLTNVQPQLPPTLVVLNPGDTEIPTPSTTTATAAREEHSHSSSALDITVQAGGAAPHVLSRWRSRSPRRDEPHSTELATVTETQISPRIPLSPNAAASPRSPRSSRVSPVREQLCSDDGDSYTATVDDRNGAEP